MLSERVKQWTEQWKAEGMEAGRQQGLQEGRQEGVEQGLRQGLEQGLQKGEAELLLRQLTSKFGPIDQPTRAGVLTADGEQLLVWGERVLTAETLAEVFGA